MKRKIIALAVVICSALSAGAQRRSVEERVAQVRSSFENTIKGDNGKLSQINTIFTDFYTAQEQIRQNLQAPKNPGMANGFASGMAPQQDFQSIRQKNETLIVERDQKLKRALTQEQYKAWKESIEPSLRRR